MQSLAVVGRTKDSFAAVMIQNVIVAVSDKDQEAWEEEANGEKKDGQSRTYALSCGDPVEILQIDVAAH